MHMGAEPLATPITVLMPIKNYHPRFVRESLESLRQQTCEQWRLAVVVERCDVDEFSHLIARFLDDPRISLLANEGQRLAGAINTGMRWSHSEFVAVLLADDLWAPDAVEVLNQSIARFPEVDFFHSSRVFINQDGDRISSIYEARDEFSLNDFKRGSPVKHLLCWRRSKGLAVGGVDESLDSVGPDDYDFPWTMAENGARFRAVKECLYHYRDHREAFRLTTHLPLRIHTRGVDRILKKHGIGLWERRRIVAEARKSYLQQCLYRNTVDRWFKQLIGIDPRSGWREKYQ